MKELDQLKVLSESIARIETVMEGTYWENTGEHEKQARELQELVPGSGPSKTLRGEIFRAASKIYYDYYNNGFGNTWQAPAQFLMNNVNLSVQVTQMLVDHAAGNIAEHNDAEVEEMISTTIEQIYEMEDRPNAEDMWKTHYNEEDFTPEQEEEQWDDDDDDDSRPWA